MTVIFAIPRADYGSYSDLYRLIELSGYQRGYIDELDPDSSNTYIVTIRSGESEPGWPGARADIRLLDIEWRSGPESPPPGVKEIWRGDKWQADIAGGRYVPLGSHPDLAQGSPTFPRYDVAYVGYMPPRRDQIATDLRWKLGAKAFVSNHLWNDERDTVLRQSRSYLHVHQLEHAPGIAILRMVVAAAYSLPVICESVNDPGIFGPSMLMQADYAHLADFVAMWTRDGSGHARLADIGAKLHEELCVRRTFRKSVEDAL